MRQIWLIGTDHRASDVPLRERLAFQDADIRRLLPGIRDLGMEEAVILSTCNRMEIYGVSPGPEAAERVAAWIEREHGLLLAPRSGKEAVDHLMKVSAGLVSMVIGEGQILAQIRHALALAREAQAIGPILNALFENAVAAGKRVRRETPIASGVVSVGSAAVRQAKRHLSSLDQASILILGAGQMGELTLKHLKSQGAGEVTLTNRDEGRGQALAERLGVHWLSWDAARLRPGGFDAVFVCTGAMAPVVDAQTLEPWAKDRRTPILLVDLAMPRNVAPELRRDGRVVIIDLDDLKATVKDNQEARLAAMDQVMAILNESAAGFMAWLDARSVTTPLYAWADSLCEEDLVRALTKLDLDDRQREGVLTIARGLAHKLLHRPVAAIWDEPDDRLRREKAAQVATLFGVGAPVTP